MTRIFSGEEAAPDDVRCRRSDGKGWRCPRAAAADSKLCDHHDSQLRKRNRLKSLAPAPPSEKPKVKIRRKKKKKTTDGSKLKRQRKPPSDRRKTKRQKTMEEELVAPPNTEELKTEEEMEDGSELILDLPNGVMHIPLGNNFSNVGTPVDRKIGFDYASMRRTFRSKNATMIPLKSFKEYPYLGGARLGKRVELGDVL